MSERKVITKYYPPDFDPSAIGRQRKPRDAPTKLPTVRLMAPFSMKCASCGEYCYRGRKFNARKQVTDQTYYSIPIIRFYIKCTRCAGEMTFTTDPKNNDYAAEKGMRRNFEPWRESKLAEETEEERLDRLEREEAERDPMKELEEKAMDAQTEMKIADKLDEIRTRNARLERRERDGGPVLEERQKTEAELERERLDVQDAEEAQRAFQSATGERIKRLMEDEPGETIQTPQAVSGVDTGGTTEQEKRSSAPNFSRTKKRKIDHAAVLGIKKADEPMPTPAGDDDFW